MRPTLSVKQFTVLSLTMAVVAVLDYSVAIGWSHFGLVSRLKRTKILRSGMFFSERQSRDNVVLINEGDGFHVILLF
jgi:hypothetical protein